MELELPTRRTAHGLTDRQTDGPLLDVQMLFGVAGARDSVHGQK